MDPDQSDQDTCRLLTNSITRRDTDSEHLFITRLIYVCHTQKLLLLSENYTLFL
jgi:hypothetical protein